MKVVETQKVPGHAQYLILWCPGCKCLHPIYHKREDHRGPVWGWNGSYDKPTFTPSLLVRGTMGVCHSFITDGRIQFLSDCTHHLRGQTVDMVDDPLSQCHDSC